VQIIITISITIIIIISLIGKNWQPAKGDWQPSRKLANILWNITVPFINFVPVTLHGCIVK